MITNRKRIATEAIAILNSQDLAKELNGIGWVVFCDKMAELNISSRMPLNKMLLKLQEVVNG